MFWIQSATSLQYFEFSRGKCKFDVQIHLLAQADPSLWELK